MSNERNGVPYQFYMDVDLHRQVMAKLGPMDLAPFMRMAMEQFAERTLTDSLSLLEKHNNKRDKRRRK